MERLDSRARKKISGPAWHKLRPLFDEINKALLTVSPSARGKLMTIYVKYVSDETGSQPYAVLWLKKSSQLVLGLALPQSYHATFLAPTPPGYNYAGLTAFLTVTVDTPVPEELTQWVQDAYDNVRACVTRKDGDQ